MSVTGDQQIIITIPLFLKKLWRMVNDEHAEDIIGWNAAGDGFIIYDQVRFITELLPKYFKHNNLASFVRQLNFYDFHKVANTLKNELEFAHPYFLKDLPETLGFITRKCPNLKSKVTATSKDDVNEILNGVKELKSKYHVVDNELKLLKQENAALWGEINSLRMKYSRQTKIINKLIHFLITYMHSHRTTFSKQNVPVSKKHETRNLKNGPHLLQIDYLNSKQLQKLSGSKRKSNLSQPSSSKSITVHKLPTIDIENLLQETSEDFPRNYTVSYPEKQEEEEPESVSEYPIQEILTGFDDPSIEESSSYTVKFPKNKTKKPKPTNSQISLQKPNLEKSDIFSIEDFIKEPLETEAVLSNSENLRKKLPPKRKLKQRTVEDISKFQKTDINIRENSDNTREVNSSNITVPVISNDHMKTSTTEHSPSFEKFQNSTDISPSNSGIQFDDIKTVPSTSRNVIKYNIRENPKENLGMFLENSQVQLGHLQEILNNLNANEIVDLANCFNVTDNNYETDDSQTDNLNLISQELEDELSELPIEVSSSGNEGENQVCFIDNLNLDSIQTDNIFL